MKEKFAKWIKEGKEKNPYIRQGQSKSGIYLGESSNSTALKYRKYRKNKCNLYNLYNTSLFN